MRPQETFGERVARERAARRRKAKQRAARQPAGMPSHGTESEAPTTEPEIIELPQSDLLNEVSVLSALIAAGLARSHNEARRLFREAGILVNDQPVLTDKAKLRLSDVRDGFIKLGLGTMRHVLVRPT